MNDTASSAEVPAREYRLFVREGPARFYFKNNDEGVWLSERGIGWHIGGISHTRAWSEIATIHLQVSYVPRQGSLGCCILYFSDGTAISVITASQWGAADPDRNGEYGRFLTDLHRMIPQAMRQKIVFECGSTKARHTVLVIAVVVAAISFLLLPLGILIYFRSLEALLVFGAGAAFVWPMFRMIEATKPDSYDPAAVPEHLFP